MYQKSLSHLLNGLMVIPLIFMIVALAEPHHSLLHSEQHLLLNSAELA